MVQHLLLMFAAPSLVVAGAPGQPLLDGLPGRSGQTVKRGRCFRAAGRGRSGPSLRFLTGPVVAVVILDAVMVGGTSRSCSTWPKTTSWCTSG